jgi:hypothetical protein
MTWTRETKNVLVMLAAHLARKAKMEFVIVAEGQS